MSAPVVVRTPVGEFTHAAAAYFATVDDGLLELFADDLTVIERYEPGEWNHVFRMGSKQ